VQENKKDYAVRKLCGILKVSASGYYAWTARAPSKREQRNRQLLEEIKRVSKQSRHAYGGLKTWKALRAQGIKCGKNRVLRLRRENKIEAKRRKRFKVTTNSRHNNWIAPNLLNRNFKTDRPNAVWVGDVTFIATRRGWMYLSVLLDLYSRKVIGWSMSGRNDKHLVLNALEMALVRRKPDAQVMHHTDRGSNYTCEDYRRKLAARGMLSYTAPH
jgi:putative transposase